MAAQTLNDVLSKTRDFHSKLSKSLNHSASESENTRAQMLLGYLRDHEKTLALLAQLVDLEQHEAMLLSYEGSRAEDI